MDSSMDISTSEHDYSTKFEVPLEAIKQEVIDSNTALDSNSDNSEDPDYVRVPVVLRDNKPKLRIRVGTSSPKASRQPKLLPRPMVPLPMGGLAPPMIPSAPLPLPNMKGAPPNCKGFLVVQDVKFCTMYVPKGSNHASVGGSLPLHNITVPVNSVAVKSVPVNSAHKEPLNSVAKGQSTAINVTALNQLAVTTATAAHTRCANPTAVSTMTAVNSVPVSVTSSKPTALNMDTLNSVCPNPTASMSTSINPATVSSLMSNSRSIMNPVTLSVAAVKSLSSATLKPVCDLSSSVARSSDSSKTKETSLMNLVQKFLSCRLPLYWFSAAEKSGVNVMLMSYGKEKAIQRRLYVSANGEVEISVHCKPLPEKFVNEIAQNAGELVVLTELTFKPFCEWVLKIVNVLRDFQICTGIDHPVMKDKLGDLERMVIDENPYQECRYQTTLRSKQCLQLVSFSKIRCAECSKSFQQCKKRLHPVLENERKRLSAPPISQKTNNTASETEIPAAIRLPCSKVNAGTSASSSKSSLLSDQARTKKFKKLKRGK